MKSSSTRMQRYRPWGSTLLSVALLAPIFPPLEWHGLVWFALVPWFLGLRGCGSLAAAAMQGFWLNFWVGFFWAYWLPLAFPQYLGLPVGLGIVALVLNTAIHQLHMPLVAAAYCRVSNRTGAVQGVAGLLVISLLYVGLDWVMPGIFQHTLGIALHDYRSLGQLVEIGGPLLLTFVVLVVNLSLVEIVEIVRASDRTQRESAQATAVYVLLVALVVGGGWGYGTSRFHQVSEAIAAATDEVRVGIVQGNVANETKRRWARGDMDAARQALDRYLASTKELFGHGDKPDLVVWPETAYPGIFRKPENEAQASLNVVLDRYIAEQATPFVLGAYDREERTDTRILRNAMFFIEPAPEQPATVLSPMSVYHKYILFPVGETLPGLRRGFAREWLPTAGAFSRGEGPKVVEVQIAGRRDPLKVGPSICYEDLFPAHPVGLARAGAELLVNISNDSWFGDSGLPRFHLIFAKLRSVETRLPQVRVTNTGYSALILPNGEVREESEYGRRQAMTWSVPITRLAASRITVWGDWFGPACLVLGAAGLLWGRRR